MDFHYIGLGRVQVKGAGGEGGVTTAGVCVGVGVRAGHGRASGERCVCVCVCVCVCDGVYVRIGGRGGMEADRLA